MSKVYQQDSKKKLKRFDMINQNTGEVGSMAVTIAEDINRRYPMNGHKQVYVTQLENLTEVSKTAQRLFFALIKNVDEWNRIVGKWKDFIDAPANHISTAKKELDEAGFISKLGKCWVLNPYVALPKYQKNYPNSQYEAQRIWTRYLEDANAYYDGIDADAIELYGVSKYDSSNQTCVD